MRSLSAAASQSPSKEMAQEEAALLFHHSRLDDLLARLFSQRSLPAADFNAAAEEFFVAIPERALKLKSLCAVHIM
jgi:hypothetical protein